MTSLSQMGKWNKKPLENTLVALHKQEQTIKAKLKLLNDCERIFQKHGIDCGSYSPLGVELDQAMSSEMINYIEQIDEKVRNLIHQSTPKEICDYCEKESSNLDQTESGRMICPDCNARREAFVAEGNRKPNVESV